MTPKPKTFMHEQAEEDQLDAETRRVIAAVKEIKATTDELSLVVKLALKTTDDAELCHQLGRAAVLANQVFNDAKRALK